MGIAAYNRGSAAIAEQIRRDFEEGRGACDARTVASNLHTVIDRMAAEIAKLQGNLLLVRDGKTRNHKAYCKIESHFRGYRRHMAGIVKRLIAANTEKERQRLKLARCVREHLTPEQWLEWSAQYNAQEAMRQPKAERGGNE